MSHRHGLNRRDFLKLSGIGLGGATLASCERRTRAIELTAVPTPAGACRLSPAPTLAAGEAADTVLVNGNIVTMDAARSTTKALAIKNGLIRLSGDDIAVRGATGGGTEVIDLHGRTVITQPHRRALPHQCLRVARHHLRRRQLASRQHHSPDASQGR